MAYLHLVITGAAKRAIDCVRLLYPIAGGRLLAPAVTGIYTLLEVVTVVGPLIAVFVDGGILPGTDIVKALALGARAALVGRTVSWGLAVAG